MYAHSYNAALVAVSVLVGILAFYTGLEVAGRITAAIGRGARWGWLAGGAFAMGVGLWAMHFIGMLALELPFRTGYDPGGTLISVLIAVGSSAVALWLVGREQLSPLRLGLGALLVGAGIASMHYTGMAAMGLDPSIDYIPWLFWASIAMAAAASGVALWIAFRLRRNSTQSWRQRLPAALLLGLMVAGMHYTGVAAAQFARGSVSTAVLAGISIGWQALLVTVATLAVISIALIVSVLDARLDARTTLLSTSLADANQELTYLALHDKLTKLPNRALLEDRLTHAIQSAQRGHAPLSVMFIDLDGFKAVNDSFGHHVGDQLLVGIAARIRAIVRVQDTVARLGGDEFVLLTGAGDARSAACLAEKLLAAISEPICAAGHELRVSASIGVALYYGEKNQSGHELVMNADAAMYHAKALGRNSYRFFEASMSPNAQAQLQLLHDLRLALERGELMLYYQAKIDAQRRTVVGAEALLRWQHPERGLISPAQFIPLAEESGLIVPIGEWVLNEACRQRSEWRDLVAPEWTVAVNLSTLQFSHAGLVPMVQRALDRHSLEARSLTLEITETTAMSDAAASMTILRKLASMGVKISIDDFGTGYSSLLYLKRLPATEIKIDGGFVRDLANGGEDAAIVSVIVALGKMLNLKIVAEGIEAEDQLKFLSRLGCDSLQGYLLGRPLPASEFRKTLLPAGLPVSARLKRAVAAGV